MTVAIREDLNKSTIWQPVTLWARLTDVPWELAAPTLQTRKGGVLRGVKVNDLSPLWPQSHFRAAVMFGAKLFVKQMAEQDEQYQLVDHEGDLRVYGPYQPKAAIWTAGVAPQLGGRHGEWFHPGFLDFQIGGRFVAKYGRIPEFSERSA